MADLHRWWYAQRGIRPARLLVETFIALDLWWTLRTGSVPFWLKFPVEPDAAWLARYLETTQPYDEIGLTLFCHGVESAGWMPADAWRRLLEPRAPLRFVGANPRVYPRDFASFARLRPALEALPSRHPMPAPLTLAQFDRFLEEHGDRYPVTIDPAQAAPTEAHGAA